MTPDSFSRVARIGLVLCAVTFQFAPAGYAQTSAWDSGVFKDWFKDDKTPIDQKNAKKPQKPIHRLAPTTCDDCQKIVEKLQAALDDWYALELADATDTLSKWNRDEKPPVSREDARAQKEDALAGLGQKERPPPNGKTKADVQKEIKKLSDALQECLKKCAPTPTPTETPTPTPTTEPPGGGQAGGGPELPILPKLPDCWQSAEQKKTFYADFDTAEKKLLELRHDLGEFGKPFKGTSDERDAAIKSVNGAIKKLNELKEQAEKIKDCGHGMAPRQPTGGAYVCFSGPNMEVAIIGTGETIGHVADVRVDNLTDQPIDCSLPPTVLESGGGKSQDYVIPHGQEVALRPHESKTIPMDGICVNRHKPPVGNGIGGDLVMNDPTGDIPQDSHSHLKPKEGDKLLRLCTAKYDAVDRLQKDGAFKDFPYRDKEKQKEIALQWSTWSDPRISEIEGGNPATKDDLKKVVEKQVGKVPPDEKKKIDKGIDTIWDKIDLTNEKAKDLEEPEGETVEETPPVGGPEYVGQTGFGHTYAKQPTATPTPKPKGGGKTKSKPTPTQTPTPTPKPKGPGTQSKPTPTPTPTATPDSYKDPADTERPPPVTYPFTKTIDCGTINIS